MGPGDGCVYLLFYFTNILLWLLTKASADIGVSQTLCNAFLQSLPCSDLVQHLVLLPCSGRLKSPLRFLMTHFIYTVPRIFIAFAAGMIGE